MRIYFYVNEIKFRVSEQIKIHFDQKVLGRYYAVNVYGLIECEGLTLSQTPSSVVSLQIRVLSDVTPNYDVWSQYDSK